MPDLVTYLHVCGFIIFICMQIRQNEIFKKSFIESKLESKPFNKQRGIFWLPHFLLIPFHPGFSTPQHSPPTIFLHIGMSKGAKLVGAVGARAPTLFLPRPRICPYFTLGQIKIYFHKSL